MCESVKSCRLCPRECGASREQDNLGVCRAPARLTAARASLHMWEEPCISGERGSGTIFFSGCPLKCVFCQNSAISHTGDGKSISQDRLCEIFFELREHGAHNINLVSPTPYIPQIKSALEKAKTNGLALPIVFNSSGYEKVELLKELDGLVDIYLPDFKYMSSELSQKYSSASDYPSVASSALAEMVRQAPTPAFDDDGMMTRGVIVRHLVLPSCTEDSKRVIEYLYKTYGDSIYISVMSQYTPSCELLDHPELACRLTEDEYDEVVDFAIQLGVTRGFIQEGDAAEESFIPAFDNRGI